MKLQTAKSAVLSIRCAHRDSSGRQCRLLTSDAHSGLCPQHRAEQAQIQAADHFPYLSRNFQLFQTAQGINYSLMNLYQLLAQNRISPRRAAVLSYITSLLLHTLPAIDADKAAGIFGPPRPVPIDASHSDEDIEEDTEEHEDSDPDSVSASDTETQTGTQMEAHPDSTNSWDPSLPEPDPKKKPS